MKVEYARIRYLMAFRSISRDVMPWCGVTWRGVVEKFRVEECSGSCVRWGSSSTLASPNIGADECSGNCGNVRRGSVAASRVAAVQRGGVAAYRVAACSSNSMQRNSVQRGGVILLRVYVENYMIATKKR